MKFLFEASGTPIYQRIIAGFSEALRQIGHEVFLLNPGNYSSSGDYLRAIQASGADYCVLTNALSPLALLHGDGERFLFEFTGQRLIFIHHDSIAVAGFACDQAYIGKRIAAYRRVAERGWHFCIESSNLADLRAQGMDNAHPLSHASEFCRDPAPTDFSRDISFVGHVTPPEGMYFDNASMNELFRNRVARLDEKIEPVAAAHADRLYPHARHTVDWFSAKYLYISGMHQASQAFRGEVVRRMKDFSLDIFGGDPGYLNAMIGGGGIDKPGLRYHGPTRSYSEASSIYAASRINLNITSLQFDDAVINRVIDAAAAGGFVLTDWKPGLRKLTSVCEEISYRTIDEMNGKIEYYLVNEKERREIAGQLHRDIVGSCRYHHIVEYIVDMTAMNQRDEAQPLHD